MCPEKVIRRLAGSVVLLSLALGWWVDPAWFLWTALAAVNLLQSSFTGFCPLEQVLARAGWFGCTPAPRSG